MADENSVQAALTRFLRHHHLQDYISDIDDIVLNYVISILEDLGDSKNTDDIDVDQFIEMMDAYIPGFANIDSVVVFDWMFELSSSLNKPKSNEATSNNQTVPTIVEGACSEACSEPTNKRQTSRLDSSGDTERSNSESSIDDQDESLQQLIEMFPDTLQLELEHCIHNSNGDIEQAVQLVLHRQESGETIVEDTRTKERKPRGYEVLDEKKSKEKLLERYGFIDVDDDKKQYKPTLPKNEPKKMIRYLDNQIVNTKGQKFTEIKRDDSEEMKKTYINLKPARKYRFH
ncbi:CUE domain-containing protein 2 [Mactra antiquata]